MIISEAFRIVTNVRRPGYGDAFENSPTYHFSFYAATHALAEGARYRSELHVTWSAETHPFDWPAEGGHMSDLAGVTRNSRYVIFADGRTATTGLKLVAENGRSSIMLAQLGETKRRKRTGEIIYADGLEQDPGIILTEFNAGTDSGVRYFREDSETRPAASIRSLATPHILTANGLFPVDKYVIMRIR